MRRGDQIILPYAVSDTFSTFATTEIATLMQAICQLMTPCATSVSQAHRGHPDIQHPLEAIFQSMPFGRRKRNAAGSLSLNHVQRPTTASVTGANPEKPSAFAAAGERSITRPR
jgi:hypothetical protein